MSSIRAVLVVNGERSRLALREVSRPKPTRAEALIRVGAISLNRGEIRMAREQASEGFRPGWDFAGTIVEPAADGSTPCAGARVVGMLPSGAWCEEVVARAAAIAVLPDELSLEQAAAFPVAGLTALHALRRNEAARNVLITGASGGVGVFAIQLARHMGASITAVIRNASHEAVVRRLGADNVVIGSVESARPFGGFDLIIESVGGDVLGRALTMLVCGGVCVIIGATSGSLTTFDAAQFRLGGTSLYGLVLGHELRRDPPSPDLAQLIRVSAAGRLDPVVEVLAPWEEIGRVADDLIARRFVGKAVLRVGDYAG